MKYSLRQIYFASLILIAAIALIALTSVGFFLYKSATNHAIDDYKAIINFLDNTIGNPFWIHQELTHIPGVMDNFLAQAAKHPGVLFVRIVDQKTGKIIQSADRKEVNLKIENLPSFEKNILIRDGNFRGKPIKELSLKSRAGDWIWLGGSFESARQEILRSIGFVTGLLIIFFIIFTALIVFITKTLIGKNVATLILGFKKISQGDYNTHLPDSKNIEAQEIFSSFNFLVQKLEENKKRGEAVSRAKSEFISITAHQLRTPLSAIKWIFSLILEEDDREVSPAQKELLKKGEISTQRMIVLVNDLLNVSRIEEGRFGYIFKEVSLAELIKKTIAAEENKINERKIKFILEKPKEKLPAIMADEEKLSLAFQNLIENALNYTLKGGWVKISLKYNIINLLVEIEDNGIGIPKNQLDKLFTKFFRGSNAIKLQTEGSGFGLFIAKNIIEKHQGKIEIESEEGKGTKVIVVLPKADKPLPKE